MIGGGLLAASAGTTAVVIAAQLVSGVGGVLILPNSLAILGATFADPHRRTEVITVWAASSGIGVAVGPLLAGVLLGHFGWQAVFVPNAVLGVIRLLVAVPFATESLAPADASTSPARSWALCRTAAGLVRGAARCVWQIRSPCRFSTCQVDTAPMRSGALSRQAGETGRSGRDPRGRLAGRIRSSSPAGPPAAAAGW